MKLFEQFKNAKQLTEETKYVRVYRCSVDSKEYEIILTRKIADGHTIIHCKDELVVWQQVPRFFNWSGSMRGEKTPIYKCVQDKNRTTIFVIKGNPNEITGLDEGVFRSADRFDEACVNVMSYNHFKTL